MQQRREEGAPGAGPLASPVTEGHEPRNCCHNSNFRKIVLETVNATAFHYLKQLIPGSELGDHVAQKFWPSLPSVQASKCW